ncbi:Sec-independent protein translocase protein (TatC) [Rubripirellula lacrimiformis]|uniref:Sec-independent protein translocase protein (TatC) n=1 Tax=Rubripirellula lacrimiformis TaxID=1930273 RepID=A0A517NCP9_9BACT|nr:hypothetical protein [Rubripirellula lacrimiformis]QDT04881.1 Sec-independent protein translocase protein (TatC) [Rubripirellula lacrimiformis]
MPFSLGAIELLLLAVLAIPVALLYARNHRHHRVGVAIVACAALAALITPADIVSMLLLFAAFAGVFLFGSRYRLDPPSTIA